MERDNQIYHMFVDKRHSNVVDVLAFRGADCGNYCCVVVADVRARLAVSNQET
jgi:hypothetical protein